MTRRESILGAALLFAVVAGVTLFLQLREARQQTDASQEAALVAPPANAIASIPAATPVEAPYTTTAQAPAPAIEQAAVATPVTTPDPAQAQAPPRMAAPAMVRPTGPRTPRLAESSSIITSNDQDGDGVVTREEARIADAALNRMWDVYDVNRDGRVDAAEIGQLNEQATDAMNSPGGLAASIMANNDLDRDGVITREEARIANKSLNTTWNQFDRNRDGKIDRAEIGGRR